MDNITIALGGEVKALGDGRVGGYILSFGTPERRDLYGDYFTATTEFGFRKGLHSDVYIHHRFPLLLGTETPEEKAALESLAGRSVGHLDVVRMDDVGIWAEHVLDMADDYQRRIYEMVQLGKLKYSTGTSPHLYNREVSGEIKTWVIAEASLTPTPAEWRATNVVVPIRSLNEAFTAGLTPEQFQAAVQESLKRVSAVEEAPAEVIPETTKAGRVLSTKNESDLRTASELILAVLKQVQTEEGDATLSVTKSEEMESIRTMLATHIEQYEADRREDMIARAKVENGISRAASPTAINLSAVSPDILSDSLRRVSL